MRWTFLAPSLSRPAGGAIALFEVVNALARAGDQVRVLHVPTTQGAVRAVSDLPWVEFDPAVEHRFDASLDALALPTADALVYTTMVVATAVADGGAANFGLRVATRVPSAERRDYSSAVRLHEDSCSSTTSVPNGNGLTTLARG